MQPITTMIGVTAYEHPARPRRRGWQQQGRQGATVTEQDDLLEEQEGTGDNASSNI